jgi:hypothetical protein
MSSMMNRFGGTILATRFIVYMYCAIASPGRKKEGGIITNLSHNVS